MRSEKQQQKAKEWGHFLIHDGPSPEKQFMKEDKARSKRRRRALDKFEDAQERRKLREVWD